MSMSTPEEKAQCVSWLIETKTDIQRGRNYTTTYGKEYPARQPIVMTLWTHAVSTYSLELYILSYIECLLLNRVCIE